MDGCALGRPVEEAAQGDEQLPVASLERREGQGLGDLHVETGIEAGGHAVEAGTRVRRADAAARDHPRRRLRDLGFQRRRRVMEALPAGPRQPGRLRHARGARWSPLRADDAVVDRAAQPLVELLAEGDAPARRVDAAGGGQVVVPAGRRQGSGRRVRAGREHRQELAVDGLAETPHADGGACPEVVLEADFRVPNFLGLQVPEPGKRRVRPFRRQPHAVERREELLAARGGQVPGQGRPHPGPGGRRHRDARPRAEQPAVLQVAVPCELGAVADLEGGRNGPRIDHVEAADLAAGQARVDRPGAVETQVGGGRVRLAAVRDRDLQVVIVARLRRVPAGDRPGRGRAGRHVDGAAQRPVAGARRRHGHVGHLPGPGGGRPEEARSGQRGPRQKLNLPGDGQSGQSGQRMPRRCVAGRGPALGEAGRLAGTRGAPAAPLHEGCAGRPFLEHAAPGAPQPPRPAAPPPRIGGGPRAGIRRLRRRRAAGFLPGREGGVARGDVRDRSAAEREGAAREPELPARRPGFVEHERLEDRCARRNPHEPPARAGAGRMRAQQVASRRERVEPEASGGVGNGEGRSARPGQRDQDVSDRHAAGRGDDAGQLPRGGRGSPGRPGDGWRGGRILTRRERREDAPGQQCDTDAETKAAGHSCFRPPGIRGPSYCSSTLNVTFSMISAEFVLSVTLISSR